MSVWPEHVVATSWHGRRGTISNAFAYKVDFLLIDPDSLSGPAVYSRNRFNLMSVEDRHHGGEPGKGKGAAWAREVLAGNGFDDLSDCQIRLLTQPSALGYNFNPVSFWLLQKGNALLAVIAEVNNTFGDRHCYFCAHPDRRRIAPGDRLEARKTLHVSPFQNIAGTYGFWFAISPKQIAIRIEHSNGAEGVIATLTGARKPATSLGLTLAGLRRPFGGLRVMALIHWQAAKLWRKGAVYTTRPAPPADEVSR